MVSTGLTIRLTEATSPITICARVPATGLTVIVNRKQDLCPITCSLIEAGMFSSAIQEITSGSKGSRTSGDLYSQIITSSCKTSIASSKCATGEICDPRISSRPGAISIRPQGHRQIIAGLPVEAIAEEGDNKPVYKTFS